jgi:GNAT superfamily N-acetyltransferase
MSFILEPMDEPSARAIVGWRYEPPYDIYNPGADGDDVIQTFLDPRYDYHCLFGDGGDLVAYCCFGPDAQVPGGDYAAVALDIGLGVRPDLTGQGQGRRFVQAVLELAADVVCLHLGRRHRCPPHPDDRFRVTVAAFNERALRVWKSAGFRRTQTFQRDPDGMRFVILERAASSDGDGAASAD